MKIGIFGGTFNPPHQGHSAALEAAIAQLGLDQLYLVPTATPPHKTLPEHTPSPALRLEMLDYLAENYAFQNKKKGDKPPCHVQVSTLELDRGGLSYTIDTLSWFQEQFPQAQLWLILGEDQLESFPQWKDPQQIASLASLCTFCRSDALPSPALLAVKAEVESAYGAQVQLLTLPLGVAVSSTQIREKLATTGTAAHIFQNTQGIIWRNQLYGTSLSMKNLPLSQLRTCALSMIPKPKRVRHVLGVEDMAVQLANRWNQDETSARRAGILHDCTKYWTHQQHLDYCDHHNFPLDPLERESEKLLHAKSGGCLARDFFGEEEGVWQSILYHTTGRGKMTPLDKILYLADYVEVNRDFPQLEQLRTLCFQDLDKAMAYGLEITLEEMRDRGKITHQNTLDAAHDHGVAIPT